MTKQTIVELGDPRLRQVSQPIDNVTDDRIQQLSDRLLIAVQESNGVGIAAPQVGELLRLFVVASRPNLRYPYAPSMEPTVMLNPRIVSHSNETESGWEGCLSVPGIRGLVPRSKTIQIEYVGRDGTYHQQELTGFVARIFQHELDHLDGMVFLDRVASSHDLMTEQEFQKQVVNSL